MRYELLIQKERYEHQMELLKKDQKNEILLKDQTVSLAYVLHLFHFSLDFKFNNE